MGTFALELSLWDFRFEFALNIFRFETLVWELPLGNSGSTNAWEPSLGNFGFGSLALELWLGIFALGSWAWGIGILRMGEPLGHAGGNMAGPRAAPCL